MSFNREHKPTEWLHAELRRFKLQLPVELQARLQKRQEKSLSVVQKSLVNLSQHKFDVVVLSLVKYAKDIGSILVLPFDQHAAAAESNIIVLQTVKECFEKFLTESASLTDEMVQKRILPILCSLILHPEASSEVHRKGSEIAGRIIYLISKHHFSSVFSRISKRLHVLTTNSEDSLVLDDLELIRFLHVPIEGLVLLFQECSNAFKSLKKNSQLNVLKGLCKAIWNWIETYPEQLTQLYKQSNIHLSELSDKLFTTVEQWCKHSNKKAVAWPLQILLILLSPLTVQEASGGGQLTKGSSHIKRQFLDNVKKSLSSSRSSPSLEHALLACVNLCKASTFIAREDNIICFLVSEVLNELKTLLFTSDKPFISSTGLQVDELMVDLFVASFRINYRNSQHFEICFQPDTDPFFQIALVKGIHQIIREIPLQWWPSKNTIYSRSTQVRNMFQQCIRRMTSFDTQVQKSASYRSSLNRVASLAVNRKKDETNAPSFEKDAELLLWLVKLFHTDPEFALNNPDKNAAEIQASSMQIMNGLIIIMMFTNIPDVSLQVSEALLTLHSPENIELWNPEAPMATFWEISSHIVYNVADRLLSDKMPDSHVTAMTWLQKIMKCRIEFIENNLNMALMGTHMSICKEALTKLETMFLNALWSTDTDKVVLAMKCFGLLYEECSLLTGDRPSPIHPVPISTVYYKLADETKQTGRTALHKRIMSILKEVNFATPGNTRAWEIGFAKWQKMTQFLTNYPREDFVSDFSSTSTPAKQKTAASSPTTSVNDEYLEQYLSEWTKITGFLCSLGAIFVNQKGENKNTSQQHAARSRASTVGLEDSMVNRFISELLTLLVCCNEHTSLNIRSTVKEALGFDLSTPLYPSFFFLCKATTACFFDANDQVKINSSHTVYVEQLIYVIRCILENKSNEVSNILAAFPVEEIILAKLRYIRALNVNVQSLVIKSKMCQLVENIMLRRSDISFRQEMKFRNTLLQYLCDWVLHSSEDIQNMSKEVHAISCTLDEAAMKAIAVLLKGLPLQPDNSDQDITEAKSDLFLKHFTLFTNILNKCYGATDKNSKESTSLAPHFVKLRQSTVQAMSNMLSANIDSGLMHSVGLAYHGDTQTRATFLEVLTEILKQGTEFENLAETVLEDRLERMVCLVLQATESEDLPIAMALCNAASSDDMDEVSQVLVNIFDSRGSLHVLLWNLFRDEVDKSEGQQTLFRGNTIASKAMTYSFKIYGSGYLHLLLTPLLKEMTGDQEKTYEVDSARLEHGENKADNTQNLIELANKFMEKVKTLKDSFPPQLRSLCYCLNKAVQRRFPSTSYDAVASAVFLRFINPAIVSPASHGIVNGEIAPNVRRGLMLLSKILQNLANHLHFTKEAHMEVFNGFLENNFHRIHSFFREISSKPGTMTKDKEEIIPLAYSNDTNVLALHKLLWLNQEKMAKSLAKDRNSDSVGGRDPFDKLVTLLAHLGPPESQHTKLAQRLTRDRANSIGWKFEEFMARHAGQNQDELEQLKSAQLFYGDGKSIGGRPVFYYIARRYVNDQVSDEVLLYHILLTLQPKYGESWELVVDLTHTSRENRFKLETIAKAFVILPESQIKNLHAMYFYNMSTSLRQYVELNERVMRPLKNNPVVVIIEKLSKFYDYISPEELKLPGGTFKLEDDTKSYQVAKISSKGSIILRINAAAVQITQTEKVKILGFPVLLNDIFYASEIERASSHDEILELNFSTNRLCMKFYTAQAEEIANSISHIQARWKLSQPDKKTKLNSKKIRPKDVPGTLLNMALINLGNNDPNLRLAAYNLLCALTATFGLRVNERLLEAKGICIPANCTVFINSISQQLSEREPTLTLEFLDECISCLDKTDDESRNLCLNYIAPWLPNLARFASCSKSDPNKLKMMNIIEKLIKLTISNRKNYPFIQSSVWGNIGKIPDLLDVVFDLFVKTSSTGGFGSEKAEVMADTTVTLASANIPLVSKKLLDRFHTVIDRTNVQPTKILERHLMWDDIAILARYLLMLSFNNSVDVSHHLPDIFHIVTLLVATGPASLRASIHGLVINSLQSVLTCTDMVLSADTQLLIRTKLEDLSLQKFYLLFGVTTSKVPSIKAFPTNPKNRSRTFNSKLKEDEQTISLPSLELITEVLLEVVEACMNDIANDHWLRRWRHLASSYAFIHNPAIQSRCIVVMGTICKQVHDRDIIKLLEVLAKACGFYLENHLIEAVLMCLAKYQTMLLRESDFHTILFWVAVGVLQFGEQNLYPAALNLLQSNLHTCHSMKFFDKQSISDYFMAFRKDNSLLWIFKQLDHMCGLNFSNNFDFALAALLLKGLRHPLAKTKSTTLHILNQLVAIGSHQMTVGGKEKFEVNKSTVPYLAVLLPLDEETRSQLNSEQVTFVAKSFTLKRTKSKALLSLDKSDRKPSVLITVSGTDNIEDEALGEKRYLYESGTYNHLLNPEVLCNENVQALLVVLLATVVDHTMDDLEMRILFELLAEASILYPEVFPIAYSILNRKICMVISHSDDNEMLESVQTIVHSTSSLQTDKPTIRPQYLTSIGFHGIHSFPGPFTEAADPVVAPQMFARFVDGVLTKYTSANNLASESRSVSGNLFKPPTYVDDNILCTTSASSTSLNTIQTSSDQTNQTTTNIFSVFKRVGSYSPARRQKKGNEKPVRGKDITAKEAH